MNGPRFFCLCLPVCLWLTDSVEARPFRRGDVDQNGVLEIADAVSELGYLFLSAPEVLWCLDAADVDDNGRLEVTDAIFELGFLFQGGAAPPSPFGECGEDPTDDALSCEVYVACEPAVDTRPPVFGTQVCTEIGCSAEIVLEIGAPFDVLSLDSCNWCSPIPVTDDSGIARVSLQLTQGARARETTDSEVAFELVVSIEPPSTAIEIAADGIRSGSRFIPYGAEELVLPSTLAPGMYTRRVAARDAAGNVAFRDHLVTVTQPEEAFTTVESSKSREVAPDVPEQDLEELVRGSTDFALRLYQAIRAGDDNLFCSPYSISVALAMTYAGARGETAEQMASTLHLTLPGERLHAAFNALDLELLSRGAPREEQGEPLRLSISNSIWGQEGYVFLPSFLDELAESYGALLRLLDFASDPEGSRLVINDWVSEQTNRRIENLLPSGIITSLTRLVLTNTIFFKASWLKRFPEEFTRDGAFHRLDGTETSASMMALDLELGFAAGDGYQAIELLYLGKETSMVVLVPDRGRFEAFESSLDASRLDAILSELRETQVILTMPRFEFDFTLPLKDTLAALGMPAAFSGSADFSGMDGTRGLFIQDVRHKAFIAVDEAGTEAAAATAVVIGRTSVPPAVTLDRPFIFLIRDIPSGAVLFLGRVTDPTAE